MNVLPVLLATNGTPQKPVNSCLKYCRRNLCACAHARLSPCGSNRSLPRALFAYSKRRPSSQLEEIFDVAVKPGKQPPCCRANRSAWLRHIERSTEMRSRLFPFLPE